MSVNHIFIYRLGIDVTTQIYDNFLMTHLSINGKIVTSELCAINRCRMYNNIFFVRNIFNHRVNCLIKSAVDNYTPFSLLNYLNCPRKQHISLSAWRVWIKALQKLYDENKVKLRALLKQCKLDDGNYISSCECFLSHYIHTLHFRSHETWRKYTWSYNRNRACRRS